MPACSPTLCPLIHIQHMLHCAYFQRGQNVLFFPLHHPVAVQHFNLLTLQPSVHSNEGEEKRNLICFFPQMNQQRFYLASAWVQVANCSCDGASLNSWVIFSLAIPDNTAYCSRLQQLSDLQSRLDPTSNGMKSPAAVAVVTDQKLKLYELLLRGLPQMLGHRSFLLQQESLL